MYAFGYSVLKSSRNRNLVEALLWCFPDFISKVGGRGFVHHPKCFYFLHEFMSFSILSFHHIHFKI